MALRNIEKSNNVIGAGCGTYNPNPEGVMRTELWLLGAQYAHGAIWVMRT